MYRFLVPTIPSSGIYFCDHTLQLSVVLSPIHKALYNYMAILHRKEKIHEGNCTNIYNVVRVYATDEDYNQICEE